MKSFWKNFFMFVEGGLLYEYIEVCFKNATNHNNAISWTMAVVGGIVFIYMGLINKVFTFEMPLWLQAIISTIGCILIELVAGLILNVWLKMGVWDYSGLKYNFMGQICLQFSFFWFLLSYIGIFLDDFLRAWIFNEETPHYHLFKFGKIGDKTEKLFSM